MGASTSERFLGVLTRVLEGHNIASHAQAHLTAVRTSFSVTLGCTDASGGRGIRNGGTRPPRRPRRRVDRHALPRLSLAEMIVGVVPQPAIRVDHHKRTHTMVGHPRARMHRALLVIVYTLAMSGAILESDMDRAVLEQ